MKKIFLGLLLLLVILFSACSTANSQAGTDNTVEEQTGQDESLTGVPCHQMSDGTWMGDCEGVDTSSNDGGMHSVSSEFEFLVEMIPHHQEAIDSSVDLLGFTENEELIYLASDIMVVQDQEIMMMNEWLDEWYPDRNRDAKYEKMMPDLVELRGNDLDRSYLEGMIHHHEMAVLMAEQVLALPEVREEVILLAEEIIVTQNQEIEMMEAMLAELN